MMRAAMADFERAIASDPGYALAHAQLGMESILYGLYLEPTQARWVAKGRAEVSRALELEPELGPHLALSRLLFSRQEGWNLEGAMRELQRAEEIEPDSAHLDRANVAVHAGLETVAIREAEAALKLNPGSKAAREAVGDAYAFSGRWGEALVRGPDLVHSSNSYALLESFVRAGRPDEALKFALRSLPERGLPSGSAGFVSGADAGRGRQKGRRRVSRRASSRTAIPGLAGRVHPP